MPEGYRKYTCPACNGKGCQLCQGKGTVVASKQEIDEVKALLKQLPPPPQTKPVVTPKRSSQAIPLSKPNPTKPLALILTLLILGALAIGALFSFIYFKSLQPFLFVLTVFGILFTTAGLWQSSLVKGKEPEDFLLFLSEKEELPTEKASPSTNGLLS